MYQHGGDIYRNRIRADFSINVNPLGIPKQVKAALRDAVEKSCFYPDMENERLRKSVSGAWKIPEQCLLFGNGASELFMAVFHALQPKKTVIPVPSFYGYEHAAEAVFGESIFYEMKKEYGFAPDEGLFSVLTEEIDLLVLANPNNPTGLLLERDYLQRLLRHCRERGIYVVLDECFLGFCEKERSAVSFLFEGSKEAEEEKEKEVLSNVLLIRAFTKLFAIPGVRLGYLIGRDTQLLKRIKKQLPEWNISCFAQAAGCACIEQKEYLEKTKDFLYKERQFLKKGLLKKGISFVSGEADFLFFYSPYPLYEALLERGILIRDCSNFRGLKRGYYRIAVKNRRENGLLLQEIEKIMEERKAYHEEYRPADRETSAGAD